ncbi:hypothetical protein L0M14_25740 [Paenibacillus hexagrammi]|uniref:YiaAB two helix domain-containing protein n=2 Tax=Paenibacillus hexagrammi TaxID=2908839 RepID=A0ABY3SHT1_9BACL|nr:YiaA/YiaB family inner membrane protein [Paenibacillus sp. YPD9-1]UJF32940.1 hypothetical protein L0M14_25740 [Paenibacillus sp. YPD9-1]
MDSNFKYQKRNTPAFTAATYFAFAAGLFLYGLGIFNAEWELNVKGYYLLCMFLVVITSIVTQKVVRDNTEDRALQLENPKHRMRNTPAFTGMAIVGLVIGFAMFFIGLFNASFELNVKGYYIAVMLLIAYSAIGVQKVTRDNAEDKLFMEQTQGHNQNTQA